MFILLGIQRENLLMTNHTNYHLSKFQFNQPVGFKIFPIVYDQYLKKNQGGYIGMLNMYKMKKKMSAP